MTLGGREPGPRTA